MGASSAVVVDGCRLQLYRAQCRRVKHRARVSDDASLQILKPHANAQALVLRLQPVLAGLVTPDVGVTVIFPTDVAGAGLKVPARLAKQRQWLVVDSALCATFAPSGGFCSESHGGCLLWQ